MLHSAWPTTSQWYQGKALLEGPASSWLSAAPVSRQTGAVSRSFQRWRWPTPAPLQSKQVHNWKNQIFLETLKKLADGEPPWWQPWREHKKCYASYRENKPTCGVSVTEARTCTHTAAIWQLRFCEALCLSLARRPTILFLSRVLGTCWPLCCEKASWPFSAQQTLRPLSLSCDTCPNSPDTDPCLCRALCRYRHWLDGLVALPVLGGKRPLIWCG